MHNLFNKLNLLIFARLGFGGGGESGAVVKTESAGHQDRGEETAMPGNVKCQQSFDKK